MQTIAGDFRRNQPNEPTLKLKLRYGIKKIRHEKQKRKQNVFDTCEAPKWWQGRQQQFEMIKLFVVI